MKYLKFGMKNLMKLFMLYINRYLDIFILIFLKNIQFFIEISSNTKILHFPLFIPDSVSFVNKRIDDINQNIAPCIDCLMLRLTARPVGKIEFIYIYIIYTHWCNVWKVSPKGYSQQTISRVSKNVLKCATLCLKAGVAIFSNFCRTPLVVPLCFGTNIC